MSRADLLSLSPDDLATLANRGLVKRAQSELEGDQISYTLSENAAGTVSVLWSDDVHCLLPSGASLQNGKCSCAATGLCRHLIRSVLAYQREHPAEIEAATPAETEEIETPAPPAKAWNPGEISDEILGNLLSAPLLNRARKIWDAGHVIEITVGAKPKARFHTLGVNTRFLVPHDARYTHCDCAENPLCVHLALAVWAFRELAPNASSGLISTREAALPVPAPLLDALEQALGELAQTGVAGAGQPFLDKWSRLERDCRAQELVWPGEIMVELARQIEMHAAHNARFEPGRVAQLAGELLVRCDAIRAQTGAVPDVFVRGAAGDKTTEVGAARLIGIGTQAKIYRGGVELSAFFQDSDSGAVVFIKRDFPDPKNDDKTTFLRAGAANANAPAPPQPFWKLAASPVLKGVGIGALGSGQVLARGGKRAPDGEFSLGRTPLSFNFQNFEWEKLRAPLLCEGFAEIEARLSQAAPALLRPRRAGENLCVVPIASVENARFFSAQQEVRAIVRDFNGASATLIHPFSARGAAGVEALLEILQAGQNVRFAAGRVARNAQGLTLAPLALVWEHAASRSMLQPWLSQHHPFPQPATSEGAPLFQNNFPPSEEVPDPVRDFFGQLSEALGELWLLGLQDCDEHVARQWRRLHERGGALGFSHFLAPIEQLCEELNRKSKVRQWDPIPATKAFFQTVAGATLATEIH